MKKKQNLEQSGDLRRRAQERLADSKSVDRECVHEADALALVHELQVHKIEMELQNEELQRTRDELEERVEERTEDLLNMNRRLASVLETITECYFSLDREWRFLEVNPAAERLMFGRPANELLGKNIWREYPQAVNSEFYRQYHLAITERQPAHFEGTSLIGGGRWFEGHAYPRLDRLEVYLHDITDRKEIESALQKSEDKYRSLFESMSEGFALQEIICDESGKPVDYRLLDVNAAFERLTGLSRAEVIGRTALEVAPKIESCWIEACGRVALNDEPVMLEEFSAALGKHLEVYAYSPAAGQCAALFADVTERKVAEAQQQAFYRRTILAATQGKLMIMDRDEVREVAGPAIQQWDVSSLEDVSAIVESTVTEAQLQGMDQLGVNKLMTCAVEGTSNVLKHAGSGKASLHQAADGLLLMIEDEGPGIGTMDIPDVALLRGYSTAGTLGMGYKLMIVSCRRVYLATGPGGTTAAFEVPYVNTDDTALSLG